MRPILPPDFVLAVLALLFLSAPARADWSIDRMDEQIAATNVILGLQADPFCSGTVISKKDRLILTADHCVADMFVTRKEERVDPKTGEVREVEIREQADFMDVWQNKYFNFDVVGQNHFFASVKFRDSRADVAILQVADPAWKAMGEVSFAPKGEKAKRGETVYVVGNPAGILDASVSKGIVSAPERKLAVGGPYKHSYFQIDATIIGGNSGGSVFNDKGELIGVVSAAMTKGTIGFIVPIEQVRDMLATAGFPEFGGKTVTPVPNAGGGYPYGGPMRLLKRFLLSPEQIEYSR
jgi:S1-C subfamily serine protease